MIGKRGTPRRSRPLGLGLLFLAYGEHAEALEARVGGNVSAQYYQVSSPFGEPVLRRRRYTQVLSLDVDDLVSRAEPTDPRLDARVSLRLDTDLGIASDEVAPSRSDVFVPGVREAPLDVMFAYVEGRNYFDGLLGFRAGRQYVTDVLGWWSFDGASVRLATPAFFAVQAYGGFEQRGGLRTLSTSAFEADGVFRGDRADLETNQWPEFLNESRLAPAYAVAVESSGLAFLDARVTYRKVINRDTVAVSPLPDEQGNLTFYRGDRVSTERGGASIVATAPELGSAHASAVYDFYLMKSNEHAAGVDWFSSQALTVGVAYDYYRPSYDADSIFNWFVHHGMTAYESHVTWRATRRLTTFTRVGLKEYGVTTEDSSGTTARLRTRDVFTHVRTAYSLSAGSLGAAVSGQIGPRMYSVGTDIDGFHEFARGAFDTRWLLSLYDFDGEPRPTRGATSFTYVAGGGVRPFRGTRAGLEWEHTMNALAGHRFRLLATLEVTVQ